MVDEKVYERYVDVVVFAPNLDFSQQTFFDDAIQVLGGGFALDRKIASKEVDFGVGVEKQIVQ